MLSTSLPYRLSSRAIRATVAKKDHVTVVSSRRSTILSAKFPELDVMMALAERPRMRCVGSGGGLQAGRLGLSMLSSAYNLEVFNL